MNVIGSKKLEIEWIDSGYFEEPKPPFDWLELTQLQEHKDYNFRLMIWLGL
jgi:hypothetical protein